MSIASDLFRTVTVKIHDISQQLPYIVVNQADDNGKIIRFIPMDHGQKVTGFTGARLYYPPRSDAEYGDYVTGVESDGALETRIAAVEERVGKLEAGGVEPGEPEEPADEWPEWVRPTSKDTQYRKGDKVTFNGRHYVCEKNNVSSSPDEDSKRWRLVE